MTPELLAALQSIGSFDPAHARSEHAEHEPLWQLYLDLVELDKLKLEALIEKHHENESADKLAIRQSLAAVWNLVPTVLGVIKLYLFAEEPVIDVGGDQDLERFLSNCDGNGKRFADYVRHSALPMSMTFGWVDCLVQNPYLGENVVTAADAREAGVGARVVTVTPLQRLDWSCQPNGAYNWLRFRDVADESKNPLDQSDGDTESYVTLSAAGGIPETQDLSVWIRHSRAIGGGWSHEADYSPTARVPVASMFYQESIDPLRPHWGVSKIATIAVLTKLIIQTLSWTVEDILANLAITCMPSKGGRTPINSEGAAVVQELTAFTTIWFDAEATQAPMVLQGDVSHITAKLDFCGKLVAEILRLAHLSSVSGEGSATETSGFHAVVNRSELFEELKETAGRLETFTLDVLALAKSWATGEDWSRERLTEELGVAVTFNRGPYATEPLEQVAKDVEAVVGQLREVSGKLVENQFKKLAKAAVSPGSPDLGEILKEIEANTGKHLEEVKAQMDAEMAAAIGDVPAGEGNGE